MSELEPFFNGSVEYSTITNKLDVVLERKLTSKELRHFSRTNM